MIGVSRLLKSCATPPVSWPSVSSFCASCNCSSAVLAFGGALLDPLLQIYGERVQFLQPRARLILALAGAPCGLGEAD